MARSSDTSCAHALGAIVLIVLFALPARNALAEAQDAAATAQFVFGTVTLVKPDGNREPIERGAQLTEGDTLVTGEDGRVHLRFGDGGFVSLIPNSEFRIDAWHYTGELDGSERLAMRLLKGGLRTMTGRVGKLAQAAYEMATRAATIGIRGTEYTLLYLPDDTLSGSVAEGKIAVCNTGGCLDVIAGNSFLVLDPGTQPALTEKAAEIGAPPRSGSGSDKANPKQERTDTVDLAKESRTKPKAEKSDKPARAGKLADARSFTDGFGPLKLSTSDKQDGGLHDTAKAKMEQLPLGSLDADQSLRTRVSDMLLEGSAPSGNGLSKPDKSEGRKK